MKFERRDIVLIAGIFLVILGITQYVPFEYSALIGIALYFAVKIFVAKRQQSIKDAVGDGLCMECGSPVIGGKCPNCDDSKE